MKGEFTQSFILSLLIRDSIIALHFCNLLLQFLHLLLLQHFFVFDRDYLDELVGIAWPVIEHGACQFGTGVQVVLADELVQFLAVGGLFDEAQFHHFHKKGGCNACVFSQNNGRLQIKDAVKNYEKPYKGFYVKICRDGVTALSETPGEYLNAE